MNEQDALDSADADEENAKIPFGKQDGTNNEEDMLTQVLLPSVPRNEKSRRKSWLALPKQARVAIGCMH